jgi:hypothetical protein
MNNFSDIFPVLQPSKQFRDTKDPCPVFDGTQWHIFGSGGSVKDEKWMIYHATAPAMHGPWKEEAAIDLQLDGSGVAAPGVIFDDGEFRMFVQTEFMKEGGKVEYLHSKCGFEWTYGGTALYAISGTDEAGIYDPHPAVINGMKYIVYSGMKIGFPSRPDIYLSYSLDNEWDGPWMRLGKILDHSEVSHHNQHDHDDYEWGLEGPQIVRLPDDRILLNATCFLPEGERGTRQRVFFAVADSIGGPYESIGTALDPIEKGENGHSTVLVNGSNLHLFYQSRMASTDQKWRYGIAAFRLSDIFADAELEMAA